MRKTVLVTRSFSAYIRRNTKISKLSHIENNSAYIHRNSKIFQWAYMRKTVIAVRSVSAYMRKDCKISKLRMCIIMRIYAETPNTAQPFDAQNLNSCAKLFCVLPQNLQNKKTYFRVYTQKLHITVMCVDAQISPLWSFPKIRRTQNRPLHTQGGVSVYVRQWEFSGVSADTCRFLLCEVCVDVRKIVLRTGWSF